MELADEVVAVLTPNELKTLRKQHAGWTLARLSEEAKISTAQLSQFENGRNGLRLDQILLCEKLLLRAAAEREQSIAALFSRRERFETMAASRRL
jgi:transcriptional regulator with XRE-family HTH domain